MQKSVGHHEETIPALRIFADEILQYEELYSGRSARAALSFILRNENNFFFKKGSQYTIESIRAFLVAACSSPYSLENLAILREKLVLGFLTERNGHKLLKQQCKHYSAKQLIELDSCFYLMFMGAAKN